MYRVVVNDKVVHEDLPRLDDAWKAKILAAIKTKLTLNPETFGKPLRKSLKNYRSLRVHDYRVIFRIEGQLVKVVAVQHRSMVYKQAAKRLGDS